MATVVLVRHGETTWNRDQRIQGWAPSDLTTRGETQADRVGAHLAREYRVDRVVSSDLRRARQTTTRIQDALAVDARYDAAWRERDYGVLQGLTYDAAAERTPDLTKAAPDAIDPTTRPDRGERLIDLHRRVIDAWERLHERASGETVVVVTHGGPIRIVLGHLKGLDIPESITHHDPTNCGLTTVDAARGRILRENETLDTDRPS